MSEKLKPFKNFGGGVRHIFDLQECSTWRGIRKRAKILCENHQNGAILEVGCGAQPYRNLISQNLKYTAIDVEDSDKKFDYHMKDVIYYNGIDFPFQDESFEIVFHTEVLEHVVGYEHFLEECFRVLKKNGNMLLTIPFQARFHYIPFDYWRFTSSGLIEILEKAGFQDIEVTARSKDVCVAAYKTLTLGYQYFFSKNLIKITVSILLSPIWAIALLVGQLSLWLEFGSEEDCLGYTVMCKKGKQKDGER